MSDKIVIKGKKILITGGAGFIGSNLCESLLNQGNDITCLDNLSTGFLRNIEHLIKKDNFRPVQRPNPQLHSLSFLLKLEQDIPFSLPGRLII